MPLFCSLTGVDARTDLDQLVLLTYGRQRQVEFAVLYSHSRAGNEPRYPERKFVAHFGRTAHAHGVMAAVHLCGSAVADFVAGEEDVVQIARGFRRVQLNFSAGSAPFTLAELNAAIGRHPGIVITQHNDANREVAAAVTAANHHVLFDSSLGKGIRTVEWPEPLPGKTCGFAGGIGPDNAGEVVASLRRKFGRDGHYWIDMESRIRDADDRFDLDACRAVLGALPLS